tara:strand:- start:353 stop:562 length:210 start_codon:yes stop_codon:yes gene_type:complete
MDTLDIRPEILKLVKERMALGAKKYGGPISINDKRDFGLETLEELLDAIVYLTIKILQIRNKLNDKKRD